MRVGRMWVALLMMVAMVAAGCSGGGATTKTPEKSPDTTNKTTKETPVVQQPLTKMQVRLAPGPKGGVLWLPEMVAEGIGAFTEQGIDLSVLNTTGGNDAAKAVLSGEAEMAMLAFDHVLKNQAQGADIVVVAFLTKNPGLVFIVQPELKDSVKSIKDLKGKKVGVSSLGGGTHMTVLSMMNKAGMQPNEIEFVAAKDKLAEMWDSKEIAAAMHVDPQITQLVAANKAHVMYDFRASKDTKDLYGDEYPLGTLVTRRELIQKNPEMVQRVVNAIMKANQYIQTHTPAEVAAKVPADYTGGDQKLYAIMAEKNVPGLAFSGTVSKASMDVVLKELRDKKVIPADAKVDLTTAVDMTFVNKASVK